MGKGTRTAAWALAASLTAGTATAGDTAPGTVTIRLDDLAQLPARDLDAAKSEMYRIFHQAGLEITWVEGRVMPRPGQLTLILLKGNAQATSEPGDVAGEAVRQTSRAYVYCNRLDAVTKHLPVDANVILGRVMAHEVGHLLLPPNSHTRIGIMRPHVDFEQVGVNTFSHDQAQALRGIFFGAATATASAQAEAPRPAKAFHRHVGRPQPFVRLRATRPGVAGVYDKFGHSESVTLRF
jgi:hypothetical protein